mmetsp:Transcript_25266/g.54988  ORF Transcript_25266/g.54988 Transcript_25266/m.54988 type:complete len:807 (+) Transcript_25266:116-2536(+)
MNSKKSALGRLLRDAATALGRDGSEGEQFLKPLLDNWFDTPESLVKTSPELLVTLGIPLRMAAELIAMATSSSTGAGAASAATISSSSSSSSTVITAVPSTAAPSTAARLPTPPRRPWVRQPQGAGEAAAPSQRLVAFSSGARARHPVGAAAANNNTVGNISANASANGSTSAIGAGASHAGSRSAPPANPPSAREGAAGSRRSRREGGGGGEGREDQRDRERARGHGRDRHRDRRALSLRSRSPNHHRRASTDDRSHRHRRSRNNHSTTTTAAATASSNNNNSNENNVHGNTYSSTDDRSGRSRLDPVIQKVKAMPKSFDARRAILGERGWRVRSIEEKTGVSVEVRGESSNSMSIVLSNAPDRRALDEARKQTKELLGTVEKKYQTWLASQECYRSQHSAAVVRAPSPSSMAFRRSLDIREDFDSSQSFPWKTHLLGVTGTRMEERLTAVVPRATCRLRDQEVPPSIEFGAPCEASLDVACRWGEDYLENLYSEYASWLEEASAHMDEVESNEDNRPSLLPPPPAPAPEADADADALGDGEDAEAEHGDSNGGGGGSSGSNHWPCMVPRPKGEPGSKGSSKGSGVSRGGSDWTATVKIDVPVNRIGFNVRGRILGKFGARLAQLRTRADARIDLWGGKDSEFCRLEITARNKEILESAVALCEELNQTLQNAFQEFLAEVSGGQAAPSNKTREEACAGGNTATADAGERPRQGVRKKLLKLKRASPRFDIGKQLCGCSRENLTHIEDQTGARLKVIPATETSNCILEVSGPNEECIAEAVPLAKDLISTVWSRYERWFAKTAAK